MINLDYYFIYNVGFTYYNKIIYLLEPKGGERGLPPPHLESYAKCGNQKREGEEVNPLF
jgi:hypothetical protein